MDVVEVAVCVMLDHLVVLAIMAHSLEVDGAITILLLDVQIS